MPTRTTLAIVTPATVLQRRVFGALFAAGWISLRLDACSVLDIAGP